MKTSSFALLSAIIPIISSLALPEPEFSYPEGVTAAVVTDFEYPGKVPVGVEKREIATLEKRADHGVYFCVRAYFQAPYCVYIKAPAGVCVPLGSDLEDQVSSLGPDQGAYCRFYYDRFCQDNDGWRHFDTTYPGIDNLANFNNGAANDQLSSYQCWDW